MLRGYVLRRSAAVGSVAVCWSKAGQVVVQAVFVWVAAVRVGPPSFSLVHMVLICAGCNLACPRHATVFNERKQI